MENIKQVPYGVANFATVMEQSKGKEEVDNGKG